MNEGIYIYHYKYKTVSRLSSLYNEEQVPELELLLFLIISYPSVPHKYIICVCADTTCITFARLHQETRIFLYPWSNGYTNFNRMTGTLSTWNCIGGGLAFVKVSCSCLGHCWNFTGGWDLLSRKTTFPFHIIQDYVKWKCHLSWQ